ncbi:hypothetical protein FRC17_006894 [Serendipita sp. 399]|nr:hypothetical protein FRC17_006894 [Serendipita sp. 399]
MQSLHARSQSTQDRLNTDRDGPTTPANEQYFVKARPWKPPTRMEEANTISEAPKARRSRSSVSFPLYFTDEEDITLPADEGEPVFEPDYATLDDEEQAVLSLVKDFGVSEDDDAEVESSSQRELNIPSYSSLSLQETAPDHGVSCDVALDVKLPRQRRREESVSTSFISQCCMISDSAFNRKLFSVPSPPYVHQSLRPLSPFEAHSRVPSPVFFEGKPSASNAPLQRSRLPSFSLVEEYLSMEFRRVVLLPGGLTPWRKTLNVDRENGGKSFITKLRRRSLKLRNRISKAHPSTSDAAPESKKTRNSTHPIHIWRYGSAPPIPISSFTERSGTAPAGEEFLIPDPGDYSPPASHIVLPWASTTNETFPVR